jgi:hypothetical protein
MPEVSRFFGIVIRMYFDEHLPPHFHAIYGEDEAQVGIGPIKIRLFGNCRDRQPVMHLFCGKIAWRMTAYVKNHGNSQ